jgi:predicted DNA-binding transcriptional regulator YafY
VSQTERLYLIDQLLHDKQLVRFDEMLQALEVSPATLKRDLDYMRSRLNAPIEWSRSDRAYRFTQAQQPVGRRYALPGLWFNEREIHALLSMQLLLTDMGAGGLVGDQVAPLLARLNAMLGAANDSAEEVRKKVLMVGVGRRPLPMAHFQELGHALLKGLRVKIRYAARGTGQTTEREISPLRLVHYRENWYLDAWCHLRNEIRNFSVDMVQDAQTLSQASKRVARQRIDQALGPGYGIFAQGKLKQAKLRFTPHRARWVASEQWHPQQLGRYDDQGHYLLDLPYADHRELVMDILRYGAECEVLGPKGLRDEVVRVVGEMRELYKD